MLTIQDELLLNRVRWKRLFSVFPILGSQLLFLSSDGILQIRCNSQTEKLLIGIQGKLVYQFWQTWGYPTIEIRCEDRSTRIHYLNADIKSKSSASIGETMATATLEPQTLTNSFSSSSTVPLKELNEVIALIAQQTGMNPQSVKALIEEMNVALFAFQGKQLVSPSLISTIVDQWAERIKSGLFAGEQAQSFTNGSTSGEVAANAAPQRKERKPRKARTSLRLPAGFKQMVSRRYQSTLEKVLPKDPDERANYLNAIISQTEEGKDFTLKVASAIKSKYGSPAIEKGVQEMINAAKSMMTGTTAEVEATTA